MLHKSKLPTNYLKPIGSGVIYLLNCNNIKSKLNEKGEEGLFIGYVPRFLSYKILTKSGKIIETKHVKFLKTQVTSSSSLLDDVEISENHRPSTTAQSTMPAENPATEDPEELKPETGDPGVTDPSKSDLSSANVLATLKPTLRD